MRSRTHSSTTGYFNALRLLAAAACLWPSIVGAQPVWNPTASDQRGNTAAGTDALQNIGLGVENTASGRSALSLNTTGSRNTANGANALQNNTVGKDNTANGANALRNNTTGNSNIASGTAALFSNTSSNNNTASGVWALFSNTTGNDNTASGYEVLASNTTGNRNVAVGAQALRAITGNNNIAVGFRAGWRTTSGNNNIYIGHPGINAAETGVIRIGNSQTQVFFRGIAGAPLSGATVVVRSNGRLGVVASSARYKQDIRPLDDASGRLARLRPVSYRYKAEPQAVRYGLIAEEVDKVMPELVVRDDQNRPESVQYLEIIPLLLQERREQQARIDRQEAEITRQRVLIERLAAEVAELRSARFAANTAQ